MSIEPKEPLRLVTNDRHDVQHGAKMVHAATAASAPLATIRESRSGSPILVLKTNPAQSPVKSCDPELHAPTPNPRSTALESPIPLHSCPHNSYRIAHSSLGIVQSWCRRMRVERNGEVARYCIVRWTSEDWGGACSSWSCDFIVHWVGFVLPIENR